MKSFLVAFVFVMSFVATGASAADGPTKLSEAQALQLANVLKGLQVVTPELKVLEENKIARIPDLDLKLEDLESLADYLEKLPLTDQVLVEKAALIQLRYIVQKSQEKLKIDEATKKLTSESKVALPFVGSLSSYGALTILRGFGKWSLRKLTNSSWFSGPQSKKSKVVVGLMVVGAAYYCYTIARDMDVGAALAIIDSQKEIDSTNAFIAERDAALATKEEMLRLKTP